MAKSDSTRAARPQETQRGQLDMRREVEALQRLTTKELKAKYAEAFGEQTRSNHRQWLIKRIAWRMQANAEGGISERARRRARELANEADLRMKVPKNFEPVNPQSRNIGVSPGEELVREYKGRTIVVLVRDDGF